MTQTQKPDLPFAPHQPSVTVPGQTPIDDALDRAVKLESVRDNAKAIKRHVATPTKDTPLQLCPSNIDSNTFAGRAMLLAAGNPSDIQFDDNGRAVINATHYLIFADEGVDPETGEVSEFARTVFFDAKGQTYRTTSAHAPRRVAAMLELFTQEEWLRGIPFQVLERKSRKTGRTYHDMRIDPNAVK